LTHAHLRHFCLLLFTFIHFSADVIVGLLVVFVVFATVGVNIVKAEYCCYGKHSQCWQWTRCCLWTYSYGEL